MFDEAIYLVSSSVYELAWLTKLPLDALNELEYLSPEEIKTPGKQLATLKLLLDNLVRQQRHDGSWGSAAFSQGDRLVNTLAALTALAFNQQRWARQPQPSNPFPAYYQTSFEAGLNWFKQNHIYNPANDPADLAGIELLVPALKLELEELGVSLPSTPTEDAILKKARAKLSLVPDQLIFTPGSTLSHALEFTGTLTEPTTAQVAAALSPNGSIGNSPSATAFALQYARYEFSEGTRRQMINYLKRATNMMIFWRNENHSQMPELAGFNGLGWPVTWPVNHFLTIWHHYYLSKLAGFNANRHDNQDKETPSIANLTSAALESGRKRLPINERLLHGRGVSNGFGADEHFAVDADTTSTYIIASAEELMSSGQSHLLVDLAKVLLQFYDAGKGYFLTYPFEMTGSLTTNVHAWEALSTIIAAFEQQPANADLDFEQLRAIRQQLAVYVKSRAEEQTFWCDKWHMSPVYATYHVMASGILADDPAIFGWMERITAWLVDNQAKHDGGWAFVTTDRSSQTSANVDETFHALMLLQYISQHCQPTTAKVRKIAQLQAKINQALKWGAVCLNEMLETQPPYLWPSLWCDKTLYCPYGMLYELSKVLLAELFVQYQPPVHSELLALSA